MTADARPLIASRPTTPKRKSFFIERLLREVDCPATTRKRIAPLVIDEFITSRSRSRVSARVRLSTDLCRGTIRRLDQDCQTERKAPGGRSRAPTRGKADLL